MPSPTSGVPSFSVITAVLASDVAASSGTFTSSYPSGKDSGNFFLAMGHKLVMGQSTLYFPVDFDVTLGATTITITNKTSSAWAQGTTFRLQMNEQGERAMVSTPEQDPNAAVGTVGATTSYSTLTRAKLIPSTTDCYADLVSLGAPTAAAANNICLSQSTASSGALTLNGSLVSSGVATLDQPRAVRAVSTGAATSVLTVTGKDVYNQTMSEAITLNGTTTVNGKKAFKTISSITTSAAIANPVTVGTTDILGLPVFLPSAGNIIGELRNGNPVGGGGLQGLPFSINQTDTLAGTAFQMASPVNGTIRGISVVAQVTIVTGGAVTVNVGATPVTGLSVDVANSTNPGTVVSASVNASDGTDAVSVGSNIQIVPGSTFATSGSINGTLFVSGIYGTAVAGIRTAGGSTTTTGDVRGTYKPAAACDGTPVQLIVIYPNRDLGIGQA